MLENRGAISKIVFAIIGCEIAGAISALWTLPGVREWFPTLIKPPWTPPAAAFGPLWVVFYALMARGGLGSGLANATTEARHRVVFGAVSARAGVERGVLRDAFGGFGLCAHHHAVAVFCRDIVAFFQNLARCRVAFCAGFLGNHLRLIAQFRDFITQRAEARRGKNGCRPAQRPQKQQTRRDSALNLIQSAQT